MTTSFLLPIFLFLTHLPLLPSSPNPDALQSFHPSPSSPTTIPAFPEQSAASGCPLDLPDDLFTSIKSACTGKHGSGPLRRSRCCPVLAAWMYSAYSATALGRAVKEPSLQTASYYDLPLLPNDSETCIDSLDNGLKSRGIELMRLNQSCDVVYCECGIRLHPLSCTEAFSVGSGGDLVGNQKVERLEKDCLNNNNNNNNNNNGFDGCSKCLKTLHQLKEEDGVNTSKREERRSKMHNEDCELMGLTWLLAKNRSAYIHTVSAVLRATMMSTDGNSDPETCTLNSDGMPLAVDSSEIDNSSSSTILHSPLLYLVALCMYLCVTVTPPSVHQLLNNM